MIGRSGRTMMSEYGSSNNNQTKPTKSNLNRLGSIVIKLLPLDTDGGEGRLEGLVQLCLHLTFPLGLGFGVKEVRPPCSYMCHESKEMLVGCRTDGT